MSEPTANLTDQQWQDYLAKSHRDILWRAVSDLHSASAGCTVAGEPELKIECDVLAAKLVERLRILYEVKPSE